MRIKPAQRALLFAALALTACGPVEEEEGVLGNGSFYYQCVSWQDPSCAAVNSIQLGTPAQLPFPSEIALGSHFAMAYEAQGAWTDSNVQAASRDWLPYASGGGYFTAARAGTAWVVALDSDGGLQDMLSLTIVPVASITIGTAKPPVSLLQFGPMPLPMSGVAGTTYTFAATALDDDGNALAGDVQYSWATSDPNVIAIVTADLQSPSDTATVQYVAGGTATLYAWTSTAQASVTLTVPGGSSSEEPDASSPAAAPAVAASLPDASAEAASTALDATASLDAGAEGDAS